MPTVRSAIAVASVSFAAIVYAQMPMVDMVAGKVVQKYQSSSCEQLWQGRGKAPSPEEARILNFLKSDQAARQEFFGKIAGPVMNKMFECGMIP